MADTFWQVLKNPGANTWGGKHHLHSMPDPGMLIVWWDKTDPGEMHMRFINSEAKAKEIVSTCLDRGAMCRVFAAIELFRCAGDANVWRITDRLKRAVQGMLVAQEAGTTMTTAQRGKYNNESPSDVIFDLAKT